MTPSETLAALEPQRIITLTHQAYHPEHILSLVEKERLSFEDFCALLSPSAEPFLPQIALRAQTLTLSHFGCVKQLYTPLYLSNACINQCLYCGFQARLNIPSIILNEKEMVDNYKFLAKLGFGHILLLTGESPLLAGVDYIERAIILAKDHFPFVSLEVFPVSTSDYIRYAEAGANGITLYQETYDKTLYRSLHPKGPKSDYSFRLEGPERALRAGIRQVGLGVLLGLSDWRLDSAFLGYHAFNLQQFYWQASIQVSFPRIQPILDAPHEIFQVSDKAFVQLICAFRLFLPQIGLTLSTRESMDLRNKLIHLGITHISAGSNTRPGGYTRASKDPGQFETQDNRSLSDVIHMLAQQGFDPVLKDWSPFFDLASKST